MPVSCCRPAVVHRVRCRSLSAAASPLAPDWLHIVPTQATLRTMPKARSDTLRPPGRQAATPMAFVQAVVRGFERYGADPPEALQRAQIAPSLLRRPEARVTAAQFELLCGTAMQQLDDEALGWFSRRLPWGSYGLLCRASLGAPNLGVALKRWCRHHRLLTEDIVLAPDRRRRGGHADHRRTTATWAACASSACSPACATCMAMPAGRWTRASPCARPAFPLQPRRMPACTRCSFPGRCISTRRAPASASTPTTWSCRCAATNARCAPCCSTPCR